MPQIEIENRKPSSVEVTVEQTALGDDVRSILKDHMRISIQFTADGVVDVHRGPDGGFEFHDRSVPQFTKDYDSMESPLQWAEQWDLANWISMTALQDGELVGALLLALRTPGVNMLEGRDDLAVIWDIRVDSVVRGKGIGTMLVQACEAWCKLNGIAELRVETQTNNSSAVQFYWNLDFQLLTIDENAYDDVDEIQLVFAKHLH